MLHILKRNTSKQIYLEYQTLTWANAIIINLLLQELFICTFNLNDIILWKVLQDHQVLKETGVLLVLTAFQEWQ